MATNSPFSDPHALNWQNTHTVLQYIKEVTIPSIYESLVDDYGFANDDYTSQSLDAIGYVDEIVDSLQEVLTTYKAQMIARAFCISPFEDSPITGKRYNSWSQIAREIIIDEFYEAYSEQLNSITQ